MTLIVLIAILILGISLYDYLTGRNWDHSTSSIRNEMVFENRNKKYGAYELRKGYPKRMLLIMVGFLLVTGTLFGSYVLIEKWPQKVELKDKIVDTTISLKMPPERKIELPEIPQKKVSPSIVKTTAFLPPVVTDDPVIEDTTLISEDTRIGIRNTEGDPESGEFVEEPGGSDYKDPVVVEQDDDEIVTFAVEDAGYPGGYGAFMEYIQNNLVYPPIAIELGIQGSVTVKFVVEKSGKISNVSIVRGIPGCPECNQEALKVISDMPNWIPAKNNGKTSRQWNTLPITFSLK
jgi:protein TonB